jgi:hypothetical protein
MSAVGGKTKRQKNSSRGTDWTFWTLSKLVQNVQLVQKGRFKMTHKNCGVASLLSLAQLLLAKKIGIRADPDSSRHDLGVAIASVALPIGSVGGH